MECEGCEGQVPDGASSCPDCGRQVKGALADRAAATVAYRPEDLGLPGQVPSYDPRPASAPPPPPPDRRGVPGWLWGVLGVLLVAVLGGGAWLLLGGDDPADQVVLDPAAGGSTATPTPTSAEPTSAEATNAEPTPAPEATEATATPAVTPTPSPSSAPAEDKPSEDPPLAPLPAFTPDPVDPDAGFLVFASDDREPLPAPVTAEPTAAWTADLGGTVLDVRGDDDLMVATVLTEIGIDVVAVDPATGAEVWAAPIAGDIEFSSITLSDTVVVTIDNPDSDDEDVIGLDRATGEARWRTVATSTEGLVVLAFPDGRLGISDPTSFAGLNPVTGEITPVINGADVRLGRGMVASLDDGVVRVVGRVSGEPVHETSVGDLPPEAQWAFTADRVVVHDGAQLWASAAGSGAREWDADLPDPAADVVDVQVLPDDTILVTTVGPDATLALAPEDGTVRWRTDAVLDTVGRFAGNLRGIGAVDGEVTVTELDDGSRVGGFTDVATAGSPFADGVYYAMVDGTVSAMDLQHCTILWSVPVEGITDRQAVPGGVVALHDTTSITLLR